MFGAGTVQWSWGLDGNHDRGSRRAGRAHAAGDGQPVRRHGRAAGDAAGRPRRRDRVDRHDARRRSTITAPAAGATVPSGAPSPITGTATDTGGGVVGGVEVSTDGGATWHPATGPRQLDATPGRPAPPARATIKSRAVDDSGNIETPSAGVTVTVGARRLPLLDLGRLGHARRPRRRRPRSAVELGVKFRSDVAGYITGIRFYKGAGNTGTHVGHLWTTRRHPARHRDLHRRDRRPAGSRSTFARRSPIAAEHDLRRLLLTRRTATTPSTTTTSRTARRQRRRCTRSRTATDGPNGVYRYGAGGVPRPTTFNVEQLLGRRRLRPPVGPDTTPPTVSSVARRRAAPAASPPAANVDGDVQRADGRRDDRRHHRSSCAIPANALVPATVTYDAGHAHGDARPDSAARTLDRPTRRRSRAAPAGSRTRPATRSPPTTPGRSRPPRRRRRRRTRARAARSSCRQRREPVQPLLRRDPARRGPQRVRRRRTSRTVTPAVARRATTSSILGEMPLTAAQVTMLTDWVHAGGNLIAMRPDTQLAGLLGLTRRRRHARRTATCRSTPASAPGRRHRRPDDPVPRHRRPLHAERRDRVATLYSDATTRDAEPRRDAAQRRRATAARPRRSPTTSRARSSTRARATRRGRARSATAQTADPLGRPVLRQRSPATSQPDWVDLDKVAIPQADEQQRLLANLIGHDEPATGSRCRGSGTSRAARRPSW